MHYSYRLRSVLRALQLLAITELSALMLAVPAPVAACSSVELQKAALIRENYAKNGWQGFLYTYATLRDLLENHARLGEITKFVSVS